MARNDSPVVVFAEFMEKEFEPWVRGWGIARPCPQRQTVRLALVSLSKSGRVVSKDEIANAVWPDERGEVSDANIDRMVSRVRSRIEPDSGDDPRFIATIRGYGYQLIAK